MRVKNKNKDPLRLLANSIGDFIRYWGFRRIHGQIWTLLYLSKEPLSGAEILKQLQVSKALVSPALKQLEKYKLIQQTASQDGRTKKYFATSEVLDVIRDVLKTRETIMLKKILSQYSNFNNSLSFENNKFDQSRIATLGIMIEAANLALLNLTHVDEFSELKTLLDTPEEKYADNT